MRWNYSPPVRRRAPDSALPSPRIPANHGIEVLVPPFHMLPERGVEVDAAGKITKQTDDRVRPAELHDATHRVRAVGVGQSGLKRIQTCKAAMQLLQWRADADRG